MTTTDIRVGPTVDINDASVSVLSKKELVLLLEMSSFLQVTLLLDIYHRLFLLVDLKVVLARNSSLLLEDICRKRVVLLCMLELGMKMTLSLSRIRSSPNVRIITQDLAEQSTLGDSTSSTTKLFRLFSTTAATGFATTNKLFENTDDTKIIAYESKDGSRYSGIDYIQYKIVLTRPDGKGRDYTPSIHNLTSVTHKRPV